VPARTKARLGTPFVLVAALGLMSTIVWLPWQRPRPAGIGPGWRLISRPISESMPVHEPVRIRVSTVHHDTCGYMCYTHSMSDSISVRELRNTVSEVLRRVESGERVTVTVDRRPVAEIVPMRRRRRVPASEALTIAARHASDPRLLDDVRGLLSDSTDEA
jgi:prevent-host-death family protein